MILKGVKRSALKLSDRAGLTERVRDSEWRKRRLLILCYHSIALEDEHRWRPNLFMTSGGLKARFEILKQQGCNVLPLGRAVRLLYAGELPERAVAITFDDGTYDFYKLAYPLLSDYGYPATVYLTTYYCEQQLPVFHLLCSYMLWKRSGEVIPEVRIAGTTFRVDLQTSTGRREALDMIRGLARERRMDEQGKSKLASELAAELGVDFRALCDKRVLQLMNPAEVAEISEAGIDVQLHTHRHRSPREKSLYQREIRENRMAIHRITGRSPSHFCYPSGVVRPEFLPWLAEDDVITATTCEPGLATADTDPLLLPRLIDHQNLAPIEFEGWLSGASSILPRRNQVKPGPPRDFRQTGNISGP